MHRIGWNYFHHEGAEVNPIDLKTDCMTSGYIHTLKLTCPLKRDYTSIGNTSSNHHFPVTFSATASHCRETLWMP